MFYNKSLKSIPSLKKEKIISNDDFFLLFFIQICSITLNFLTMKKERIKLLLFGLVLGVSSSFSYAQTSTLATGGEASSGNGKVSYSVGQVVYTTNTATNGNVAQGVQQPYEISVTTGINETTINLEMSVYPNPTNNYLKLEVGNEKLESLSFQLIDLEGKVIENTKVTAATSTINIESLPKAIYFLSISDKNKLVKTFKIIKN